MSLAELDELESLVSELESIVRTVVPAELRTSVFDRLSFRLEIPNSFVELSDNEYIMHLNAIEYLSRVINIVLVDKEKITIASYNEALKVLEYLNFKAKEAYKNKRNRLKIIVPSVNYNTFLDNFLRETDYWYIVNFTYPAMGGPLYDIYFAHKILRNRGSNIEELINKSDTGDLDQKFEALIELMIFSLYRVFEVITRININKILQKIAVDKNKKKIMYNK